MNVIPAQILLVEDSPTDVELTVEALAEGRVANKLHVVRNGEDALRFLRREDEYADVPTPDIVLLDWNLPRMDGGEVLAAIRADSNLTHIPVVVLTTSSSDEDVLRSYQLHANSYVRKPLDLDDFIAAVRVIEGYWLSIVKLPSNGRS
jgi:chemotaxis family two-component system response regulator Rcp1